MDLSEAVGVWIECPRCHSRFMINHLPDTDVTGGEDKKVYYFSPECDFQSFRTQCFDLMMQSSPADVFSEMKVIEEKQCYLPYVSSIGGDGNHAYNAEYVGEDKHAVIMQQYTRLSYKNNDKRFGTFGRSHDKGGSDLEAVRVDDARIAALPQWASRADELYYYPFYCLVCSYKGTTFSFSSMGGRDIKTTGMPTDVDLRRGPYIIDLSNSERVHYASIAAQIAMAIIALCLLCFYWQEVTTYVTDEKALFQQDWETSHGRNGWFAYVLFFFYVAWLFLKGCFFAGVSVAITFGVSFCVLWLSIVIGVFFRNRYVIHSCLKRLKQTQQRKQHDAYALHNISLNKLYDKEKDLN